MDPRRLAVATRWMWVGLGVFAAALGYVAVVARTPAPPSRQQAGLTRPIDGIACLKHAAVGYHAVLHLDLFVRGRRYPVAESIGRFEQAPWNCAYALQTQDASGIVHVEAPAVGRFTLGEFFDIWGMPLSPRVLLGFQATAGPPAMSVRAYVNGRRFAGNPRDIPLRPHAEIVLEYGPPWVAPPATYPFPAGL